MSTPTRVDFSQFSRAQVLRTGCCRIPGKIGICRISGRSLWESRATDQRLWPEDEQLVPAFRKRCFEGLVSLDHDHEKFRALLKIWLEKGLESPFVDKTFAPAAIGYCFGGMAVLECIRGGLDIGGVVSFHGLLQTGEDPNAAKYGAAIPPLKLCENHYNKKAVVLIENGAADYLVTKESKERFYAEMNAAGVDWNFHDHSEPLTDLRYPRRWVSWAFA